MTERNLFHIGQKIERWTIIGDSISLTNGQKKWLCRCVCGTERYVLERSLKYGASKSCGCLRKEEAEKANTLDLEGKVFGELTVLHKSKKQGKNGGVWWTCKCSCGNLYDVPGSLIMNERRTHCGSKVHEKNYASVDITGQRFHRLTAMYPLKEKRNRGSVVWHCQCDCGNEVDVAYNKLVYTNIRSCGCQKKEHDEKLNTFLTHVAGTSVDMLKSKKVPTDNTTGYKGVYLIKGKYVAKIVFQKKAYYLGSYENIEEAAQARMEAEETIFGGMTEFYKKWKARADADPQWALENPVQVTVEKYGYGQLILKCHPEEI